MIGFIIAANGIGMVDRFCEPDCNSGRRCPVNNLSAPGLSIWSVIYRDPEWAIANGKARRNRGRSTLRASVLLHTPVSACDGVRPSVRPTVILFNAGLLCKRNRRYREPIYARISGVIMLWLSYDMARVPELLIFLMSEDRLRSTYSTLYYIWNIWES